MAFNYFEIRIHRPMYRYHLSRVVSSWDDDANEKSLELTNHCQRTISQNAVEMRIKALLHARERRFFSTDACIVRTRVLGVERSAACCQLIDCKVHTRFRFDRISFLSRYSVMF